MNGYIARTGKHHVAFGLIWALPPGVDSTRKEIKKLAQDHSASEYVILPFDDKRKLIGLLKKTATTERTAVRSKAVAAGAILATAFKGEIGNAVFGFHLPNNKASVIGFRDGIPLIGFDRIVGIDAVEDVVAEFLQVIKDQSSTVKFFGSENFFKGRNTVPFDLEWFSRLDNKKSAAGKTQRVKQPFGLIAALVFIFFAAITSVMYYENYQNEQIKKAQTAVVDPNIRYEQSLKSALASAGHAAVNVAWPMIEAINRIPLFHQGWRIEKVSCIPGTCTLSWNNNEGGTYHTFTSQVLPGVSLDKITYTEGLIAIDTTINFPLNGPEEGVRREVIPSIQKFIFDFGSFAQGMKNAGLPVTLEKANVVGIPSLPPGQPPITENVLKNPIKEGKWVMSGDWLFSDALRRLPPNMTIGQIDLAVSGDSISMTASGKYYVQN